MCLGVFAGTIVWAIVWAYIYVGVCCGTSGCWFEHVFMGMWGRVHVGVFVHVINMINGIQR